LTDTDASEFLDVAPGGQEGDEQDESQRERLLRYARRAESLFGPQEDNKLATAIEVVKELLNDGFNPILFCRFIPTAEYVADELRKALPGRVGVIAVTGTLPPAEREQRVKELGEHDQRVLVATDCLSEGVNLQDHFSAVMHYDLSWNPTRHEQREGRVDRFGQPQPLVRAVTYYGTDNQIDGIVLEVLLRKHKAIRSSLGISVPVPANSNDVVQALMQGLLLRGRDADSRQLRFEFADDEAEQLYLDWENATALEKQSRTLFAQRTIRVDEVAREWQAMRAAIGTGIDVERFTTLAVTAHGGFVEQRDGNLELHLPGKASFREAVLGVGNGDRDVVRARFEMPVSDDALYLSRTHPFVEGLAGYVMDAALDPLLEGVAQRCGAIRTRAVDQLTTLLLLRFRFHIEMQRGGEGGVPLLAEEAAVVGFTGLASEPHWVPEERAEQLLQIEPDANVNPQQATRFLERVVAEAGDLQSELAEMAERRAEELLADHERVRDAARIKGISHNIRPQAPVDVLGVYVLLPA
jgi:hypothetical protein